MWGAGGTFCCLDKFHPENALNTKLMTKSTFVILSAAVAIFVGSAQAAHHEAAETDLSALLASDSRSQADRDRDAGRKPAEVIAFAGIGAGMNVLDVIAASGYYTEVLSLAVGPEGHVTSQNPARVLQMRDGANGKALDARLADNRLPNVSQLVKDTNDLSASDGPFDAALTALNLHDVYNNGGDAAGIAFMTAVYDTLKTDGIFVVIDHEGATGNDNKALHRIEKADAIRLAEAAGFFLEAEGDMFENAADDMTQHMRSEGLRGHTQRFVLLLRKLAK
jgi:predicted methyltransferase